MREVGEESCLCLKDFGLRFSKSLSVLIGRSAVTWRSNFSVAVLEPLPMRLYPSGKPSGRKSERSP